MSPYLTMRKVSARWCSLLLGTCLAFGIPAGTALAQTSLTWAKVERLRNRVHLIPSGHSARLARVSDVMNIGDALRTTSSARAELRFNDGSLARVGEQATFRFTPNTRNFQLSNGTVLLLIPPGRGRTTIQTPNAVTGIQGSGLFVRVRCLAELTSEGYCSSPVTIVGALTNNPAGAMLAYNQSGSEQQQIYAGEMVVIEGDTISQRLEFDLRTFYQTSGLAEGLQLDSPTPPEELSEDLQAVWQEIQDALELQGDFDNKVPVEEVVENPGFIAPTLNSTAVDELDETGNSGIFASFPGFASSPAASFHNLGQPVAASSERPASTATLTVLDSSTVSEASFDNSATSANIREVGTDAPPAAPAPVAIMPNSSTSSVSSSRPSINTNQPELLTSPPTAPSTTTTIVEQPELPTVSQPNTVVEQPVEPPTLANFPEDIAPISEADTIQDQRQELPADAFDPSQTSGAQDPEVLLQSEDLSIDGPGNESLSTQN